MALWGGRFEKDMDQIVKEFNASIGFDQRMYNEDIDGSSFWSRNDQCQL